MSSLLIFRRWKGEGGLGAFFFARRGAACTCMHVPAVTSQTMHPWPCFLTLYPFSLGLSVCLLVCLFFWPFVIFCVLFPRFHRRVGLSCGAFSNW